MNVNSSNYLHQDQDALLDLIVVGGGINGAGIAADAVGRGLSVGLYEAQDFASATSSASSKLIHGGLRYLEHYEFRLVSEALAEREILLAKAPHIAFPMRFRLPHQPYLRPAWMIRIGMFLYDHLGKRTSLPASKKVALNAGVVTKPELKIGFEYSDCWVDDARLVILNILQAQKLGAEVSNYCEVESARRVGNHWQVNLIDHRSNTRFERRCKALVNATGPWVKSFIKDSIQTNSPYGIRLIKGSHIIVNKLHDEPQAYILQNEDKRIVFAIPYLDKFTMIGTTDLEYHGDPRQVEINAQETQYLLDVINNHFVKQLTQQDIISSFSGVRPLCDDESDSPQAITRDYTLALQSELDEAPLLSVFGGKLTTYRKLAEAAMEHLKPFFPAMKTSWTDGAPLPGGEEFDARALEETYRHKMPEVDTNTIKRWIHTYGTQMTAMLANVVTHKDLGREFAPGVYQVEVDFLAKTEFALTARDILYRRTKLNLLVDDEQLEHNIQRYLDEHYPPTQDHHNERKYA
ncbi:glycerol-3-phosphate dehydrogenase [Vibrio xiamenensis]|uniref:Glycerol-3-phosphate dehydrogenase n=1 Tax=Vibrio xiamenensis TaxID=861298 RepID=A0A1G7YS70_9VIBR|nr:glycerol-3-phosphate dehydrogenase [Vibrio xiamenensis]SDG99096.1 glycerol-3-phosphate dehydrogenase [Vibrio xiamenensis]